MQVTSELDQKFQSLFSGRLIQKFYDVLIVQTDSGWLMYNTYKIQRAGDRYLVSASNIQQSHLSFGALRTAATYVIFHWAVRMQDCAAVLFCDNRISSLENEIKIYNKLMQNKKLGSAQYAVYSAKRQQCENQLTMHRHSLQHYIYSGYELQQKKFRQKV